MLTLERFKHYLENIKKDIDDEEKINKILKDRNFCNFSFEGYNIAILILEDIFDDSKNGWIEYFIYDLEWGTKYKDGMITENDINIKMAKIEDLYVVLMDNLQKR